MADEATPKQTVAHFRKLLDKARSDLHRAVNLPHDDKSKGEKIKEAQGAANDALANLKAAVTKRQEAIDRAMADL